MVDERHYDEAEIAEILKRATEDDGASARTSSTPGRGLTLTQLQEIGSEVGIAPGRIADAARALSGREVSGVPMKFLGAPRSVSRVVPIDRALGDDEWSRLVVDLRETFGAVGTVRVEGPLRSWVNGNLQVHVEPDGERYRVRMHTMKGNAAISAAVGAVLTFLSALLLLVALLEGGSWENLLIALALGVGGLGQLGYTRAMLPRWAEERAGQMEGLAERIPLLLKE